MHRFKIFTSPDSTGQDLHLSALKSSNYKPDTTSMTWCETARGSWQRPPKQNLDFYTFPEIFNTREETLLSVGKSIQVYDLGKEIWKKKTDTFSQLPRRMQLIIFRVQSTIKCSIGYLSSAGRTKLCLKPLLHSTGRTYKQKRSNSMTGIISQAVAVLIMQVLMQKTGNMIQSHQGDCHGMLVIWILSFWGKWASVPVLVSVSIGVLSVNTSVFHLSFKHLCQVI